MIKVLAPVAAMLIALGSFGCSDDDSGGSGFACNSEESAPAELQEMELVGAVEDGTGVLCDTPGAAVTIGFSPEPTEPGEPPEYYWETETDLPGAKENCSSVNAGTFSYSTNGPLGTLQGTPLDPSGPFGESIQLQICITSMIEDGADTIYGGNYEVRTANGDRQTGTVTTFQLFTP
jgi:hypothetical protein